MANRRQKGVLKKRRKRWSGQNGVLQRRKKRTWADDIQRMWRRVEKNSDHLDLVALRRELQRLIAFTSHRSQQIYLGGVGASKKPHYNYLWKV